MDDEEILRCLEKNSEDKIVLEFTKKIFKAEFMGRPKIQSYYDKQIKEYGGKMKCD